MQPGFVGPQRQEFWNGKDGAIFCRLPSHPLSSLSLFAVYTATDREMHFSSSSILLKIFEGGLVLNEQLRAIIFTKKRDCSSIWIDPAACNFGPSSRCVWGGWPRGLSGWAPSLLNSPLHQILSNMREFLKKQPWCGTLLYRIFHPQNARRSKVQAWAQLFVGLSTRLKPHHHVTWSFLLPHIYILKR